jgi:hypothetical protein
MLQPSSIAVKVVLSAEERAVGLQEMLEKGVELLIGLRSERVLRAAGQSDKVGPAEQLIHRQQVVQGQPARGRVFGAAGDQNGRGAMSACSSSIAPGHAYREYDKTALGKLQAKVPERLLAERNAGFRL